MVRGVAVVLAIAVSVTMAGCSNSSTPHPGAPAAERFLAHYVTADGRVLRRDQGGDIVSEGQAYGMLIAETAGRAGTARTIWSWTAKHLQHGDGLLSYHANGSGQIEDSQPASDADVLAAYALLRYQGADQDSLHAAGRRIAGAVLAEETVDVGGAPLVVAGPWARGTTQPVVNPSYLMPSVFAALARLTGDGRWQHAARIAVQLVGQLTGDGRTLPTDWAHLDGSQLTAAPDPSGGAPVEYGLNAARLPLWFGTACSPHTRRLAGRWWSNALSHGNQSAALALSPTGTPINQASHPLPLLAGAAAASAADDGRASAALRKRAAQTARNSPTYYGDAWLALGDALLGGSLDPCKEASGG